MCFGIQKCIIMPVVYICPKNVILVLIVMKVAQVVVSGGVYLTLLKSQVTSVHNSGGSAEHSPFPAPINHHR